jgi:hypothetical protein
MKRFFLKSIIIAVLLLLNYNVFSQFSIQGEIRPRFEYRDGYKRLPDTSTYFAAFVSQRSRIYLNYKNDKIITKISFQDIRVWGDEAIKTDVPNIGLSEAWVQLHVYDSLSLKLGKQEISYDNERLFSPCNWSQVGQTHNAAMLKYSKNGTMIDFTGAFNQSTENLFGTDYSAFPTNYKTLNILWVSKKFTDNFKASVLGVADGYQKTDSKTTVYLRGTYGGILDYNKANKYSAVIRGFYQNGRLQTGQEINAYYLSGDFTYSLGKKFTLWAGMQYVSGTDATDKTNKVSNAFNTLYGSGHRFSGLMDYFSNISSATKGAGLVDPYLNFIYKCCDKGSVRLDLHYLMLQNKYVVNTSVIDKHLGEEGDLSFTYNFSPEVSLMTGFSMISATKSMEVMVGGNSMYPGAWGFVMLTVKPTFFSTEKK